MRAFYMTIRNFLQTFCMFVCMHLSLYMSSMSVPTFDWEFDSVGRWGQDSSAILLTQHTRPEKQIHPLPGSWFLSVLHSRASGLPLSHSLIMCGLWTIYIPVNSGKLCQYDGSLWELQSLGSVSALHICQSKFYQNCWDRKHIVQAFYCIFKAEYKAKEVSKI